MQAMSGARMGISDCVPFDSHKVVAVGTEYEKNVFIGNCVDGVTERSSRSWTGLTTSGVILPSWRTRCVDLLRLSASIPYRAMIVPAYSLPTLGKSALGFIKSWLLLYAHAAGLKPRPSIHT